jgi:hypothetical protein
MSKERGEELFRALNTILDAVTALNLRDFEAEAAAAVAADQGETSTQGASASSKGKAKVANPDWEDVPFNPVPITPLPSRPRFSQVVRSSSESPVVPPSSISVAACAMANAGQAGGAQPVGGNPPPPLAYATGAQFNALWNAAVTDQARAALEQEAITRSLLQDVQFAAMVKINLRLQGTVGQLAGQVAAATAAAQAAGNVDRFRPAAPPKYGNKKQSGHVRHWTPMIEDYLRTAPDADYIRLASSYLEGGPRSLWTTVYEAYKAAHSGAEPPNPRQFFRETLEANYGLQDLDQKFWDTWNSLKQGPSQDIAEYNVEFQQALTDLAGHVTDEQIKIEKYRLGLQPNLREMCRTSPAGTRWARVADVIQYATLQWPAVQERIAKRKKSSGEATKVAGKRKSSGGAGGSGRSSSKARLSASAGLSDQQHKKNMAEKLYHICHQPGHQARQCPLNKKNKKGGKVAAVSGNAPGKDELSEEDF